MRKISAALLALGLLAVASRGADKKPVPKFTLGKETTYITGPLDEDGYVDYATALNEQLGKGIKPQDNANVLLWKAFGPRPQGAKMPPEFFKRMGIPEPPERGDYFIGLTDYVREHLKVEPGDERANEIHELMNRASQRPWTAKDHPEIVAWLEANEKPLALVVEASKRPHYFFPLVPRKSKTAFSGLMGVYMNGVQECRECAWALNARAMLRVGEGRVDDAWQDLLACHRLGRLVGRGGTLIEALVGIAIDTGAGKADLAFLDIGKLSAKQIKACLRDLEELPHLPDMAEKVDLTERFMFLEVVIQFDRGGIRALEAAGRGSDFKMPAPGTKRLHGDVDLELVMRNGNQWYGRVASAMRIKDRPEREKQLVRIEDELKRLKKDAGSFGTRVKILLAKDTTKARGEAVGNVLINMMLPAFRQVQRAADRAEQGHANLRIAFALAWYQREHGRYPAKLDELAPKYLAKVPGDLFSGKALVYRASENGYLLYSVGVNGKDDEGRADTDDPPGDDLAVRMPLPKPSRR